MIMITDDVDEHANAMLAIMTESDTPAVGGWIALVCFTLI